MILVANCVKTDTPTFIGFILLTNRLTNVIYLFKMFVKIVGCIIIIAIMLILILLSLPTPTQSRGSDF